MVVWGYQSWVQFGEGRDVLIPLTGTLFPRGPKGTELGRVPTSLLLLHSGNKRGSEAVQLGEQEVCLGG